MNTYNKTIKDDPKDRIEIEIGDSKQANFYPQLKIMRWDNEVNASFRLLGDTGIHSKQGNVVKYVSDKREAHFYELPVSKEHPEGASELEVILLKKPTTNKVEFSIQSKGLEFFYQPALTQKQKDEGVSGPDNVIGSYVIYYKDCPTNYVDGKLYRNGKFGQILKPRIEDSDGKWTWGELNITGNKLTVTIPQEFLDTAVYPIRHAAGLTFGYTTAGGLNISNTADASGDESDISGTGFTLSENGNITQISAYLVSNIGTQAVDHFYAVYREDSAGADLHDLVASAETLNMSINTSATWYDINFSSELLTADEYILAVLGNGEDATARIFIKGDNLGSNLRRYEKVTAGTGSYAIRKTENPWSKVDSLSDFNLSLYATYIPDGTVKQEGFRFRDDDGSESTASFLAAQDTNITRESNTNTRLRILLDATDNPNVRNFQLEYRLSPSGNWKKINTP